MNSALLIPAFLVLNLALALYLLHKLRKVHLASYRIESTLNALKDESDALFHQFQAYQALVQLIRPEKPLPPLRGWAASPDFLQHVASHVLAAAPRTIVECGAGSSTVVLAYCCRANGQGRVFSLEHDPRHARRVRRLLAAHGLDRWAWVVDAPLQADTEGGAPWYALDALELAEPIDLLVIDGPPAAIGALARYPALPRLHGQLSARCHVFLDDAARPDERAVVRRWLAEYPGFTAHDLPAEKGCVLLSPTGAGT
ncbi:class I SAM-dependent methyltransferase [Pseudothauera nasutitermitis]|uniref:Class I SAM-dependent methyltransferase n=1 Tax=Pseudothauera nasutitermitis TaxID=2565930 RepID=A0A4S4AUK9_9RHOO|nr:class I SAM-dependent methyltransferase [Pseudothauera nasutitermitis]THF63647.1 class I SAM-dependent methyltransferase [Pseudothauera nasutitermitis]